MAPAPTFSGLAAVVLMALGAPVSVPPPQLVEAVSSRVVNTTAQTLAARRRVRLGRPIVVKVLDAPHMRAAREALSETARSPEAARDQAALYGLLGLGPGLGVDGGVPAPAFPNLSGLYDAPRGQLLIGNWGDLRTDRFTIARDVALVVLDRRFDLRRWLSVELTPSPRQAKSESKSEANSDALWARQALLEGDAAVQGLELLDPQGILPPPRALAEIIAEARAAITRESSGISPFSLGQRLFLELDGLAFVAQMRDRAPWSAIDWVWAHPPQSTEQILHPSKYQKSDRPDDVGSRLPARLRGGWQVSARDTLGELGVRTFLARATNDYRAERGASGWGGDEALLLRGPDAPRSASRARPSPSLSGSEGRSDPGAKTFAAWIITWDDETDAEDFAAQAGPVLAALAHASTIDDRVSPGHVRLTDAEGRVYALDRRQRTVGMIFAAPADAEAVLADLMLAASPRARHGSGHGPRGVNGRRRSGSVPGRNQ